MTITSNNVEWCHFRPDCPTMNSFWRLHVHDVKTSFSSHFFSVNENVYPFVRLNFVDENTYKTTLCTIVLNDQERSFIVVYEHHNDKTIELHEIVGNMTQNFFFYNVPLAYCMTHHLFNVIVERYNRFLLKEAV